MNNIIDILLNNTREIPEKQIKMTRLSRDFGMENPIIFTLRALPYDDVARIKRKGDDMSLYIILEGVKDPDLHSAALMEKYGVDTPIDAIKQIFLPGEIEDISRQIEELSGYRISNIEEVKKK